MFILIHWHTHRFAYMEVNKEIKSDSMKKIRKRIIQI